MIKKCIFILSIFFLIVSSVGAADDNVIKLNVNNHTFDVKLEKNSATDELVKKLHEGNITVDAKDYGGFEKVGNLGFTLPSDDEDLTASPGDLMLYQSNQLSLFYQDHKWDYTKLGEIQNASQDQLKNILSTVDVTITLSLK